MKETAEGFGMDEDRPEYELRRWVCQIYIRGR